VPIIHLPMTADCAIIQVLIGVNNARFQALRAVNQPQPPPITVPMLVDTGSSGCCVGQGILAPLGLAPTGRISLHTATTGGNPVACDQYDVSLMIQHPQSPLFLPFMPVVECELHSGVVQGLLGRDFLKRCMLVYQGEIQAFSLAF
jgi:hypothetical protein